MKRFVLAVLLVVGLVQVETQQQEQAAPQRAARLTFLQINDVYSTVPVDGQGGLARIATLKRQLAADGRTVLMALAGDFLSPSVASTVFRGEQMIAALNAAGLDFATLGNHEFDFGRDTLIKRMSEARFQWVVSNVLDQTTNEPIGGAVPYLIRDFGSLRVGFIGLCITTGEIVPENRIGIIFEDPIQAASRYVPILKRRGANVIVAITHLPFATDRALVRKFPDIDLVIGGHEHYVITATESRALISKAGTEAKWAARIDVDRTDGVVGRFFELIPVTDAISDDPQTARVVASYEDRLSTELNNTVGTTTVPLDATEALRLSETNLGNLMADAMRANADADVAITNGGSLRGGRMYPAGPITGRMLLAMHPFNNVVCKVEVTGRVLLAALNHGVSRLPASAGQFPQVSGLTMKVDVAALPGNRVNEVRIANQPLDLDKIYTVAITDYMLKGGDNYTMFGNKTELISAEAGDLAVVALGRYIAGRREVSPRVEGRIVMVR